jgi:O-antigen ligase
MLINCWPTQNGHKQYTQAAALAWLTAALVSALCGLLQYYGAAAVFSPWVNNTEIGLAYANLRQRNLFASLINIGLVALIWWASGREVRCATQETRAQHGPAFYSMSMSNATLLASAALLGAANAASSSRTGTLQLIGVVCLFGLWRSLHDKTIRKILAITVAAYLVASLVLPLWAGMEFGDSGILGRMKEKPLPCASRLVLWSNVLHLITEKPWLGWGWGNLDFAHFVTLYPGPRFCEILDNAHNLPLHLAVELGVPAALLVCGGGLWLVWRAKPWREQDATRQMAWGVLAVILLHSLLEYPLWYGPFQIAFGLCVALLWRRPQSTVFDKKEPLVRVVIGLFASVLIAFIGYASWDYYRVSQIYRIPKMRDAAYQDNTLEKIQGSWLFKNQVDFARLTTMSLTPDNAETINQLAQDLLHFSPEAKVVIKLIEGSVMLGRDDEALFYLMRFRAAFPNEHARWVLKNAGEVTSNR